MRLAATAAAVLVTAALTVGGAGAAHAETQVRIDAAGDTVVPPAQPKQPRRSPSSSADILSLTGKHADGRLTFTFDLADLTPSERVDAGARILTPSGRDFQLFATRSPGGKEVELVRTDGDGINQVECDDVRARFVNRRDRIVLSVPRGCVNNPRSVRFGGGVRADTAFARNRARGIIGIPVNTARLDDARRNGSAGSEIKLGTRSLRNN